jgi:hypothetical protein
MVRATTPTIKPSIFNAKREMKNSKRGKQHLTEVLNEQRKPINSNPATPAVAVPRERAIAFSVT